jgi:hypothetical protein
MSDFMHDLGLEAEDKVTGFKGILIARSQWLTGCNTYVLQPPVNKEGAVPETKSFDEQRLKITPKKQLKMEELTPTKKPGGNPMQMADRMDIPNPDKRIK